jgi:hypothetical protein
VLGIRDILVRIRICGSGPLTNGFRIQLRIRLLSSVNLRIQKIIFFIFFSYNLPVVKLSSVLKLIFLLKFCVKILFCKHYFSMLNTFMRKGKDPDPGPLTNGFGRPKNMWIRIPYTGFVLKTVLC